MNVKPITLQDAEEAYERVKDNGNPSYGDTTYKKELCRFDDGKALFFCAGTLYDGDDFNHYCRLGIENPNAVLADFEFDYVMPWNPDNEYGDVIDTEISLPISQSDVDWLNKEAKDIANGYENGELVISSRKNKRPVKSNRRPIQSMYVTEDISGNDLYTCLWSGGKDQFDSMIEDGADADDILNACEELLFREEGNPPTMTELNDLIWFEPDTIREYIGLSNPIESGCHGKSKRGKGKKKTVKSGRKAVKSSRYNPYNGEGSFLVSIEIVEDGDHYTVSFSNNVLPLEDFIAECKGEAESTNGYYYVSANGENQYKIEFKTGDDTLADESGTDPYYEESCGVVIAELIYPYNQEMADYIENGGY